MDLDRQARTWRVREGAQYLFHLEPPLDEDRALGAELTASDARYLRLRTVLGLPPLDSKGQERLAKTNYWLFATAVADTDLPPGVSRIAYGTVDAAGIHFTVRGKPWREQRDMLTHEEVHALWAREAGLAPALLNEGLAVYVEARLSDQSAERLAALPAAWAEALAGDHDALAALCRNAGFWDAHRRGRPVYRAGGALAGYLLERHGPAALRALFLDSHYADAALATKLEGLTGYAPAALEGAVAAWWRGRDVDRSGSEERGHRETRP